MAEVLVSFNDVVTGPDGQTYTARACGREMADGRWQGWIEFEPTDGSAPIRSTRETTQPNRVDTAYWATGLTPVYLEGALHRSLNPALAPPPPAVETPAFDAPLPPGSPQTEPRSESVLNPFSVYRKGEIVLRRQLGALAAWHLVNIIQSYQLSNQSAESLERLTSEELIELIVFAVRQRDTEAIEP
jgi:hypothetical protein